MYLIYFRKIKVRNPFTLTHHYYEYLIDLINNN